MHEIISEEGKVICVRVGGQLTQEDYDKLIPAWERLIAREGAMRMLLVMDDFHGWEPGAAWDDVRFAMGHASKVERIAIVGEKSWQKWMTKIGEIFIRERVRYFDSADQAEAERWITKTADAEGNSRKPRVIVITGAAAGVGRATARMFAETEGAHIGLIARGQQALEGAKRDVEDAGGRAIICQCDVADAEAVEAAAERIERELGPIDVWVNVAMTSVFAFIKDTTPAELKRVTEVCYLGYVNGTLAALKRMMPRDRGHIIQVGSALAYRGIPLQAAYCASKHAIQGFMDSLRAELIHQKSRIVPVMVQMPALNTPQFGWCRNKLPNKSQPVPPIYQPEVAARAIVFASRHQRREIYVGLPTVIAIIGNKLFPRLGDLTSGKTESKASRPGRGKTRIGPITSISRSGAIPERTGVSTRSRIRTARSSGRICIATGSRAACSRQRWDCWARISPRSASSRFPGTACGDRGSHATRVSRSTTRRPALGAVLFRTRD